MCNLKKVISILQMCLFVCPLNIASQITTGGRSKVCSEVDQNIIVIDEEEKFNKLMEILGHFGEGQSLIFVHTQQKCDLILKDLMHASYSVMSLHGG